MAKQQFSRVDTLELKAFIVKRIGIERAERYFDHLRRLFSLKLSKKEFNKLCIRTLGRENLGIHNQLIGSILKNANGAKVPPPKVRKSAQENCKFGNVFASLCRKGKSIINRDQRLLDRPSPLGPGKQQCIITREESSKAQEQQSATELFSLGSRPPVSVEDGEEVEQWAGSPYVQSKSPVTAPLGILMNGGGARKAHVNGLLCDRRLKTCLNSGELPDTRTLRTRLEQKLESEGIAMSVDSVNLLNNGLDVFLKRLIEPCIGLSVSRKRNEYIRRLRGQYVPRLNQIVPVSVVERANTHTDVSMTDFCTVMELNPQILGVNWATQLERISTRASEDGS